MAPWAILPAHRPLGDAPSTPHGADGRAEELVDLRAPADDAEALLPGRPCPEPAAVQLAEAPVGCDEDRRHRIELVGHRLGVEVRLAVHERADGGGRVVDRAL